MVIFMSNPTFVLRLCCVVVGVVSISSITFFGTPSMKVKLYQDYENQSGLNGDLFGSNYCHIKLDSNQPTTQLGEKLGSHGYPRVPMVFLGFPWFY